MTFRTRLLLLFGLAVLAAVAAVNWVVMHYTRQAFERLEAQRVDALVAQFRREFDRRGKELVRDVNGIAAGETALTVTVTLNQAAPDVAPFVNEAAAQAAAHGLDLLEWIADDGAIISSAQWPARFGYKEAWITAQSGWSARGAFLRRMETPDGEVLALVAVGVTAAGDRKLYTVGGQKLDREFLSSITLPAGMRVLLHTPAGTIDASGPVADPRAAGAETFHTLPLSGAAKEPLGELLVGSSRRELLALERFLRLTALLAAGAGVLLAIGVAWWATARVTRPVKLLAGRAGEVAAGNWEARVEVTSSDEIGQLAGAFNRMTHQLVEQRERLVQAERVAAWRELARRLAHELKNPLFPLQITVENLQRARQSHPEQFDEVFRESTQTLLAELATLKQIIARFSDFSKMPPPQLQTVDCNTLVRETFQLFQPQLEAAHLAGKLELDPESHSIQADPEQMRGVLKNLMLNAIDAMPSGGTLTLRTAHHDGRARIEVADTGQGLTPEECERLFTPYYTSKEHGTGLGLAIVQSVVSDHKGRISVESAPGKGTTFRIDLG